MGKKKRRDKNKPSQKERPRSKTKHASVQIWKKYKVENGKVVRLNEFCPKCGDGTFLAKSGNRIWCGKCGWSKIAIEKKA